MRPGVRSAAVAALALAPATGLAQASGGEAAAPSKPATVTTAPGIIITAQPNNSVSIDRRTYSVTTDALAKTGSLSDVMRNIPSVDISPQGAVSLRGDTHVTILIDGKPAPQFQGQNQSDALQAIPANLIDKIEVMPTASAEFTSIGSAGVINIVTKKTLPPGATLTLNGSFGPDGRGRAGFSGGYSKDKLSISADGSFRRDPREEKIQSTALATVPGVGTQASVSNDDTSGHYDTVNAGIKATYQLDPKTQVYAGYRIFYLALDTTGLETLSTGPSLSALTATPSFGERQAITYDLKTISAGLSRTFSGDQHQFTIDYQHQDYPRKTVLTTFADGGSGPAYSDHTASQPLALDLIKLVYRRPMPLDGRLVAGFDWQHDNQQISTIALDGPSPQATTIDPLFSDRFGAVDDQRSYYGTYQQPVGKLTVMAGVRVETEDLKLHSMGAATGAQNYARVNPSVHASYPLDKEWKITFGYSRRMDRPAATQYDPAPVYVDQYSYYHGAPALRPSTTDAFDATWEGRHADATYTATAFYRRTTGAVTLANAAVGDGVFASYFTNLGDKRDTGVSLATDGPVFKVLKYDLSADIFDTQIHDAAQLGVNQTGWVEAGHANFDWSPTADDLFQVNAVIRGRTFLAQGYAEPTESLNLGYRRQLKSGLFLTVSADDILGGYSRPTEVYDAPGLDQVKAYRFDRRALMFGFSWSFDAAPGKASASPTIDYNGGL
jgi:outer membrane receptor protein involved in Fe transport